MAESQRLLTEIGTDYLSDKLISGDSIEQYVSTSPQFGVPQSGFCYLRPFHVDEEIIKNMIQKAGSDVDAAITLYEALPDLNCLFASHGPFWTHLSHFELFDYMKSS